MTDVFPELMDTGTLTPESLLKYAADLRGRGGDGACEDFSNLRKDLGDFLLEDALYPEDDPTDIDTGDTRAEQREWLRRFMNEDTMPLWPDVRNAPKDHRVWLRKNLDLVDFMVDDQIHPGMTVRQRYGADLYAANSCRLWGEVGQPACDKPAKELMIQAVGVAAREIIATCDGVVAKMEPYIEKLKAAMKDLNEELRVPRYAFA
ncbi:hypothetical protein J4E81_001738 [Alternaria sp. BMP 2799]|nr:hypothetical protein J4E81_001738 [Alternaria sp. BMP 2799]